MSKTKNKTDNKTEKALAAEKEQFGKQQLHNISKTLTSAETPPKEKYVRNIIMGTHKEGGATTFWSYTLNLPLSSNSMISWKFCYLVHKVLRDGHKNAVRDSHRYCRNVKDMGVLWGNLHDRYGHIVALSAKYLCLKMEFHAKHKAIPGNMEASDETLDREAGNDMAQVLDMTQELLDSLDAALKMSETVLRQLDANGAKSTTPAGQCRLTPLIPLILDCSFLYHFSVLLMFKLHSRIAPDVLLGHRERFRDLFTGLTQFFNRAREMEFFKSVIQVPDLPDAPPNFLRAASFGEYKKPVVVVPNEERPEEEEVELQPEFREVQQMPQYYSLSQMGAPDASLEQRETENDSLRRELEVLKPELQLIKSEAQRCVTELKAQVNHLEAEVEEQRTQKQMAMVEKEHLRMEVEALRCANVANVGAQIGFKEADSDESSGSRASFHSTQRETRRAGYQSCRLNEEECRNSEAAHWHKKRPRRFAESQAAAGKNQLENLRQQNSNTVNQQQQEVQRLNQELLEQRAELALLRSTLDNKEREGSQVSSSLAALQAERDVLLRSAGEKDAELASLRQLAQQQQGSLDLERDRLNRELEALRAQLQQQLAINAEQKLEIDRLRRELDSTRADLARANSALQNKEMSGTQMSGTLAGLQAEKEALLRSVREQEAELSSLRQQAHLHQSSLEQERQRSNMELGSLHAQLQQQACREGELAHKLQEEQFSLLQCAVVEAEGIILDAVAKLDDPIHVCCISSPDYLVNRAEITLGSIDKMQQSHVAYLGNRNDASGLLRAVTQFSHLAADTIVNGAATSHSAPTDQADRLTDSCRDCASNCLQFLKDLKLQASLPRADPTAVRYTVQRLLALGQDLRPKGQDVLKEELGSMVDKEMIATSTAIEEAVLRMDEILSQARRDTSGIKLEVNQNILGSCSDLMRAVHMLVTAATDLQKDIVEGGRGAASVTEFYAKNSRWTEGLISASKAVGWGATQLLDSADRVVGENGRYEELIASSHEIAASTAQLVAASKVKADRSNKKLHTLQHASRHVNDMAAVVVTSTKHGQQQISDQGVMDFSGMSLIKLKTEEMEAQVRVLQLESQLEQERVRLGALRKRHYELGPSADDSEDGADGFPPPPPPTLLDSTPAPASFSQTQPYVNTQSFAQTNPFAPAQTTQSFSLPQSYTPTPTQSYTPPQTSYTPSQTSYTPSQTSYTPSLTPYTPPQTSYTPPQAYTPSQPYVPSQPYTPNPTQSYLKPQSFPTPQPSSHTSSGLSRPHSPSLSRAAAQSNTETTKPASRRSNIFTKSGNLLKNAVSTGATFVQPLPAGRAAAGRSALTRATPTPGWTEPPRMEAGQLRDFSLFLRGGGGRRFCRGGGNIRGKRGGPQSIPTMEESGSALEKNVADLTVMDVYDIAAVVGQEFERIIDQYGCEALSRLMPKVVRVLEILEVMVSRSSISPETEELRLELDKLRLERLDRLEKEKKHRKELELVEDVWRGEAQDLLSQIAQLQEENKSLLTNLSIKDPLSEEDLQRHEGMTERERQVMKKLKEVVDKQRDEIRAKDRELTLKNEDIEALQQQQSRLMKINHDLRHKISVVEAQGKALIEQKVELEASAQARGQEVSALRQEVSRLKERLQGDSPAQNPEDPPPQPPSPAEVTQPMKPLKELQCQGRGKATSVVVGAEGWSDRSDPSEPMLGGFDSSPRPLPGSLSPEGHEDGDEEAEDEAVLLWEALCEEETGSLDPKDPNRPRFTLQELRDVLHERNELKAKVFLLQEELAYYKSDETEDEIVTPSPSPELRTRSRSSAQPESGIKR
ncbi:hypothetical protein L3Q82_012399, partial [Scortum barcoo]